MSYRTIHTLYGLAALAAAEVSGVPVRLTHIAFGDGAGNNVEPDPNQTALVRELYRAPVNRVYRDPDDAEGVLTIEGVIPAAEGGWVLREVGVFDADAALCNVGNTPAVYKPLIAEGATADCFVRLKVAYENADVVTLQIDPNVAVASHSWVLNTCTAARLIPGGTTGQVLTKVSNADGDVEWADADTANVIVTTIEEQQTLVNGQTAVILAETTTVGLALYIDGARIPDDAWTPHPTDPVQLTLDTAISGSGHTLIAVQNEPAGQFPLPLERSKNLQDVPDKAAGRANLGVMSAADTSALLPAGRRVELYRSTVPAGSRLLKANGAAVSRSTYAALFAAIGTTYGAGDGVTTFNLPDDRGLFARGWDDGKGIDTGRAFGSVQADELGSHKHIASTGFGGEHSHTATVSQVNDHNHTASAASAGGHGHNATAANAGAHSHTVQGMGANTGTGYVTAFDAEQLQGTTTTSQAPAHTHGITVDAVADHTHTITLQGAGKHLHTVTLANADPHTHVIAVGNTGGTETRPRNRAVLVCISY